MKQRGSTHKETALAFRVIGAAVGRRSSVSRLLGHTNPNLLRLYAKVMDRRDGEPERPRALVADRVWTHLDSKAKDAANLLTLPRRG
jgi:hypothetical protein